MPLFGSAQEAQFMFKISGKELGVVDFTAREEISSLFEVNLSLASEDEINFDDVIGQEAVLTILGKEADRYFHGIINQFVQTGRKGCFNLYQASMVPSLWLLSLEQDCRIFQNKSVQDIVKQILLEGGIMSDRFTFRLQNQTQPRDYCVQYRETDLDFISRLLEEEGIFYFFEHAEDKHVLVFGDGTVNYQSIAGKVSVAFHPADAMVPEEEFVNQFAFSRQIRHGKVTLRDFNFKKPCLNLTARKQAKSFKKLELYDYPGDYYDEKKGKKLAEIRLQQAIMFKDKAEGQSVCPRFIPGFTFNLTDHERDIFNQEYILVDVLHFGSQPQVLQEQAGMEAASYSNQFLAIPSSVTIRPERKTPKPMLEGIQTAIVVGPAGEEIYPDEHGRIKVQFHWDREGKKDENSSCWIRVSQLWAGAGWGAMYIPRIGQEVIVDFMEGDPDRPIITGRVYNGNNTPPYTLPDEKTKSTIKSDSSVGGGGSNEIRFEDKKGSEEIYVHAQKDLNTMVEAAETHSVGADRTVHVKGHFKETIDSGEDRTVNSGSTETIDGGETRTVSGGLTESIDGGETRTVNGGQTETINGGETRNITGDQKETISGAVNQTVTGGVKVTTPATFEVTAAGGAKMLVPGGFQVIAPGGQTQVDQVWTWLGGSNDSYGINKASAFGYILQLFGMRFTLRGVDSQHTAVKNSSVGVLIDRKGVDLSQKGCSILKGAACAITVGLYSVM